MEITDELSTFSVLSFIVLSNLTVLSNRQIMDSIASYSLLHSDLSHLSGNLVGLYWLATKLQPVASQWEILVIFAVGVVMPAIIGVCIRTTSSDVGAIVGASCGVYALMGAHAALLAKGRLLVLPFATIRVEADFAWLILAGFIYMLIGSDKDVWHFGHICGGLVGFGLVYLGG